MPQRAFFEKLVRPFLSQGKKIFVIISDGMRYEIAHELASMIRQEDRYSAEVRAMVTGLPSYTQLGMAALLPHDELQISDVAKATVLVDGKPSSGIENRRKILANFAAAAEMSWKADARQAADILDLHAEQVGLVAVDAQLGLQAALLRIAGDVAEQRVIAHGARQLFRPLVQLI